MPLRRIPLLPCVVEWLAVILRFARDIIQTSCTLDTHAQLIYSGVILHVSHSVVMELR